MEKVYIVEYYHKYGTDILVANDEENARNVAVNLVIDNVRELDSDDFNRVVQLIKDKEYDKAINLWCGLKEESIQFYSMPVSADVNIKHIPNLSDG